MNWFDQDGMLILPPGTIEELSLNRKNLMNKRIRTGEYVTCPKCEFSWERGSTKPGIIRCHKCRTRIRVEKIERGVI